MIRASRRAKALEWATINVGIAKRTSALPLGRFGVALLAGALCVSISFRALAESPERAERLFQEGLEDMRAGRYDSGCPKLEESYELEPLPGALFTVAECDAAWGKGATALERYQEFLKLLTTLPPERRESFDERRSVALAKIAALGAVAPAITVDVSTSAPPALVVRRNGETVAPLSYGVTKNVDPGEYTISAELDGRLVWERRLALVERDRAKVVVPWPVPGAPAPPPPGVAPVRTNDARSTSRSETPLGVYVAGGAGALGLVVGIVAGTLAMTKKSEIEENCPGQRCNAEGHDAVDSAKSAATVSTIGFIFAGAGAGTALVLLLTAPSDSSEQAAASRAPRVAITAGNGFGFVVEGRLE